MLNEFKGKAQTGSDWSHPNGLWDAIVNGIDKAVAEGGTIRFSLDGMNIEAAFDPSSELYNTYPSRELRYVMRVHPRAVQFYLGGFRVGPPRIPR